MWYHRGPMGWGSEGRSGVGPGVIRQCAAAAASLRRTRGSAAAHPAVAAAADLHCPSSTSPAAAAPPPPPLAPHMTRGSAAAHPAHLHSPCCCCPPSTPPPTVPPPCCRLQDKGLCYCPSNTTQGRVPAGVGEPPGSPPRRRGRPMGEACQPRGGAYGAFGNIDYQVRPLAPFPPPLLWGLWFLGFRVYQNGGPRIDSHPSMFLCRASVLHLTAAPHFTPPQPLPFSSNPPCASPPLPPAHSLSSQEWCFSTSSLPPTHARLCSLPSAAGPPV